MSQEYEGSLAEDIAGESSFVSHLTELRKRLILVVVAILGCSLALLPFANQIYDVLSAPLIRVLPEGSKMIAVGVITPFFVPLKLAVVSGFLLALPYVLYQFWRFVVPALYRNEKKWTILLLVLSTTLFFLGMAFCYFFVFGVVFNFIYKVAPHSISIAPDIESYFDFSLSLFLAFGLAFELPVAQILLVLTGVVELKKLKKIRPYVMVAVFVVAAIVTPPDVLSQLMLAIPLVLLYELGLLLSALFKK